MNDVKDYGNLCKSHSARSEKEFCRVCPSKLNKKELEDVYFSLLENNLDLKKTINSQQEKIKVLSTKIQRLTAVQKTYLGKEPKDCCRSKAVIVQQKECILELQRANQSLSERVHQLNMRLCSAKQFLKRSPFQSSIRCNRCSNKTASMSALISKRSVSNLRTAAASSQFLDKDIMSSRTVDHEITSLEKGVQYDFCVENKCRTHIEEFKQKNEYLEEQISELTKDLATRTSQYEHQLSELRAENVRVRSERTRIEDTLKQSREETAALAQRLGIAEIRCDELSVELSIEKRKVLELEMRVKAADMSSRIANAIEAHLTSIKMVNASTNVYRRIEPVANETPAAVNESPTLAVPSPIMKPKAAVRTKVPYLQSEEVFKNSDDSGYTEVRSANVDDNKASTFLNRVLLEKIADLQNQINNLKASKGNNAMDNIIDTSEGIQDTINKTHSNMRLDESLISESSESVVTERDSNTYYTVKKKTQMEEIKDKDSKSGEIVSLGLNTVDSTVNEKHQVNNNVDTSRRETFRQFKKRSKDKTRECNRTVDTRKLSLESSRGNILERNLIKTGSLDENRIGAVDSDNKIREHIKKMNSKEKVTEHTKIQIDSKNNTNQKEPRNSTENVKDTKVLKRSDTFEMPKLDPQTSYNGIMQADPKNIASNKKDSDSSKGTYSIHKNDNITKVNKNVKETHKDHIKTKEKDSYNNIFTADMKKNLMKSTVIRDKDVKVLEKRRSSTPSQPRTYVLPGKGTKPRELSPDSTECEISSLSDLPSEREERAYRKMRSPGEERVTTTVSESRTDTTTTDYGSLSEGELPFVERASSLSVGETRVPNRTVKSHSLPMSTSQQMAETLAMVKQELSRCTNLLRGPTTVQQL